MLNFPNIASPHKLCKKMKLSRLTKKKFFEVQKAMHYISPYQDANWMAFIDIKDKDVNYFVDSTVNPKICCWGRITVKVPGIKILTIVGEATTYKPSLREFRDFWDAIIEFCQKDYSLIRITSDSLYDINFEVGIREAGFYRPIVYSNCPLSIIVNLNDQINRSRNWSRQYNFAITNGFKFKYISKPNEGHLKDLSQLHTEMSENKKLSGSLNPKLVQQLLEDSKFHLFMCYAEDETPLCARVVYCCREISYDIIAANGIASRSLKGSTHFLLESVFNWLKENGCKTFDFGRIGPGKSSSNSVYEFKRSSGGTMVPLNGEWVYPVKKWVEYLYFLKIPRKW
jgi:hypothetical protein